MMVGIQEYILSKEKPINYWYDVANEILVERFALTDDMKDWKKLLDFTEKWCRDNGIDDASSLYYVCDGASAANFMDYFGWSFNDIMEKYDVTHKANVLSSKEAASYSDKIYAEEGRSALKLIKTPRMLGCVISEFRYKSHIYCWASKPSEL